MQRCSHTPKYLLIATELIRGCFDYPCRETFFALCAIAFSAYNTHPTSFLSYAGFAGTILLEIKEGLSEEDQRSCEAALQVMRGLSLNYHGICFAQADEEGTDELGDHVVDPSAWNDVPQGSLHAATWTCLVPQMRKTLKQQIAESSDREQTLSALHALQQTCELVKRFAQWRADPVSAILLHMSQLFVDVHTEKLSAAVETVKSLLTLFDTYPVLLTWTREPSYRHALLDAAELLLDGPWLKQITAMRKLVPQPAWSSSGAALLTSKFCISIRDKLVRSLPICALSVNQRGDEAVFDFEAMLLRDFETDLKSKPI
jgi:hypothetical protein